MAALQSSTEGHPPQPLSRSFLDILAGNSSDQFHPHPSSTYRGYPSVVFSAEAVNRFAAPFRYALVGKFSKGRPSMESIRRSFVSIGFAGSYSLGLIDRRHILINFQREEDYARSFLKRIYSIDGFTMRILKWSPQFSVESEPAILPIWINLPLFPLHLFHKEALYSIARLIGEPLKLDASTLANSRPSVARVCVELDLRKSRPEKVWIVNGDAGFWQPVDYEKIPPLCALCHKIGHHPDACRSVSPSVAAHSLKKLPLPKEHLQYRPKSLQPQQGIIDTAHQVDVSNKPVEKLAAPTIVNPVLADAATQGVAECVHGSADPLQDVVPSVAKVCEQGADAAAEVSDPCNPIFAPDSVVAAWNAADSGLQKSSNETSARPVSHSAKPNSIVVVSENSNASLLSSSLISDPLIPELLAVGHVYEDAAPLFKTSNEDIDETKRPEVFVQTSMQNISNFEIILPPPIVLLSKDVAVSAMALSSVEFSSRSVEAPLSSPLVAITHTTSQEISTQGADTPSESPHSFRHDNVASSPVPMDVADSGPSAPITLCPQPNFAQVEVPTPLSDESGSPPLAATTSLSSQLIQKAPTNPPKQPFTRAELDELLKNVEDSPFPSFRRSLKNFGKQLERQSKAITPAPKVVEVAPLAVLYPQAASDEISSDFESEDQLCYDEDLEVQS